jgi:hypothetical protein
MAFECLVGNVLFADILHPKPEEVDLAYLAQRLDGLKRFNGHPLALTVGEHHRLCADLAACAGYSDDVVRWAALHDAHEYALGDWPAPIKRFIGGSLAPIERRWDEAISSALGIEPPSDGMRQAVAAIDARALWAEWRFCLGRMERPEGFVMVGKFEERALWSVVGEARMSAIVAARMGGSRWVL